MSSSMDPDLCRLLLGDREGISSGSQQDQSRLTSSTGRWPAACGRAHPGPGVPPAQPRHPPVRPWHRPHWHSPAGGGAGQRPPHASAGGVQVIGQVALKLPQGEVWPCACHHWRWWERGESGGARHCPLPSLQPGWGAVRVLPCPGSGIRVVASQWHSLRDTWMSSVTLNTPEVTKLSWKSVESAQKRGGSDGGDRTIPPALHCFVAVLKGTTTSHIPCNATHAPSTTGFASLPSPSKEPP